MLNILAILSLYLFGGGLDGYRDYLVTQNLHYNPNAPRIEFGVYINIPLDGFHIAKTGAYTCLAAGTYFGARDKRYLWTVPVGWLVVRPLTQNTVEKSLNNKKLTFGGW